MIATQNVEVEEVKSQNLTLDSVRTVEQEIFSTFKEVTYFDGTETPNVTIPSGFFISNNSITGLVQASNTTISKTITVKDVDCDKVNKIVIDGSLELSCATGATNSTSLKFSNGTEQLVVADSVAYPSTKTIVMNENTNYLDISNLSGIHDINIIVEVTGQNSNGNTTVTISKIRGVR